MTKLDIMPQDIEAEKALLCSLLLDNHTIPIVIDQGLKPTDFFDKRNKLIFKAIITLYMENIKPEPNSVIERLKEMKALEKVGMAYALELPEFLPATSNVEYYTKRIKDTAIRRRYTRIAEQIKIAAIEEEDIDKTKKLFEELLLNNAENNKKDYIFGDELIKKERSSFEEFVHGVKIQNRAIWGIVGATSVGKTEFALDIAGGFANSQDKTVLFCEYEDTDDDLADRLEEKISQDWVNVACAIKPDFLTIIRFIREHKEKNILIIIDYLQRFARKLQAEDKRSVDNLKIYVNQIYNFFDNLRVEYKNISVCLLSSLSKSSINEISSQRKADRISLLNGIKESGDVQYDLNYVYAMLFSDDGNSDKLKIGRFSDEGKPKKYMHNIVIKTNRTGRSTEDNTYTFDAERHCYTIIRSNYKTGVGY